MPSTSLISSSIRSFIFSSLLLTLLPLSLLNSTAATIPAQHQPPKSESEHQLQLQPSAKEISVYVIPIEGQITNAQLYILRRGLKEAVANNIDAVVLKINTPGGDVQTTLEMMDALKNFKGETLTFVDKEAMSAGAYISAATDGIYFHPNGILGAAAVIESTGAEVSETLKQKIGSYLRARVRSYSTEYRYRGDVIHAMMDPDFVFKIDDKVIKDKGELLTLTANEAVAEYGDPKQPLFASGIVDDVDQLLAKQYKGASYHIKNFELTWSEYFARWLNTITPILLGLGMLCLFIEFKTPGFGFFGITGILFLLIVFASSYVAGLAGHEAIIIFLIGLILIALELFVIPGIFVAGVLGILMLLGSILWALADIWPGDDFHITFDLFLQPLIDLALGLIIATAGILIIGRFFLKSWIWDALILRSSVGGGIQTISTEPDQADAEPGDRGVAITDLHPWGEVEIKGKRYSARVAVGAIDTNMEIEVVGKEDFGLIVKNFKQ